MIDPIAFTIRIGSLELPVMWYGIILMSAMLVAVFISQHEVKRRGEDPELVWDAMLFVLPAGIIGARLWYVINDILGGNTYYLQQPLQILNTRAGGLHIYGGFLVGGIVAVWYLKRKGIDILLVLDSVAPTLLIGQALARPANFINQELYGPPTNLSWGIAIDAYHRIPPYNNLEQYPLETRFHPTFAYEMIWNLLAAGILMFLSRRFPEKIKPGSVFAGWLLLAGIGRVIIESFRPDQPVLPGTGLSYSRLVAGFMALAGAFWLLARYNVLQIPKLSKGPNAYRLRDHSEWTPASKTK